MVAQIFAVLIFLVMFVFIITEKFERHVVTLGCGLLTLVLVFGICMQSMDAVLETLNVRSIFAVDFWYQAGESTESASGINWSTIIFITFMMMSGVLAMFIDSITVILFLSAVTVELSQLLKFNPVPMILSEIFCANLGGSATMCGDPPNIIIGTSLGYSFGDFITNTGLIAGISFVVIIFYFYFVFRKELTNSSKEKNIVTDYPDPKEAITDKKGLWPVV